MKYIIELYLPPSLQSEVGFKAGQSQGGVEKKGGVSQLFCPWPEFVKEDKEGVYLLVEANFNFEFWVFQ